MILPEVRSVVFDLDGTLIHSAPGLQHAINHVLQELGNEPLSLARVISFIGQGIPTLVQKALTVGGEQPDERVLEYAITVFNSVYLPNIMKECHVYDGIPELLANLKNSGWKIGLCTNKSVTAAQQMLNETGLASYFGSVVGGDSLPVRKPDPAPLLSTISELGGTSEYCVYVGDSLVDAHTAQNAEVPFFYFTGGYNHGAEITFADSFDGFSSSLAPRFTALLKKD